MSCRPSSAAQGLFGGVEQRFDQKSSGRLAVGTADACGGESALWMAEESCKRLRERTAAVSDFEDGHAGLKYKEMVELGRGVRDDAQRAGGNGLFDVAVAVGVSSNDPIYPSMRNSPSRIIGHFMNWAMFYALELFPRGQIGSVQNKAVRYPKRPPSLKCVIPFEQVASFVPPADLYLHLEPHCGI
jgi:hypothetical protein